MRCMGAYRPLALREQDLLLLPPSLPSHRPPLRGLPEIAARGLDMVDEAVGAFNWCVGCTRTDEALGGTFPHLAAC